MMLLASCLILGDSHADGTAAAVRAALGNRCTVVARAGIGSAAILDRTPAGSYGSAVISAGANDAGNPHLADNLNAIRGKLQVGKVVWLLPYDRRATCKNAEVDVPPQHWASLSLLSCDVPAIAMGSKKASGALLRVCEGRTLGVPVQRLRTEWSRLKPTRRRLKSCGPPPSHSRWRMCWLSLLHYTVWP